MANISQNEGIFIKTYEWSDLNTSTLNFVIPLYQRRYAWKKEEVTQLLTDLKDWDNKKEKNPYFIGTIVVEGKKESMDVIDGQQRLTTIYLISAVDKILSTSSENVPFELEYIIREKDRKFLHELLQIKINKECKIIDCIRQEVKKVLRDVGASEVFWENTEAILDFVENEAIPLSNLLAKIKFDLIKLSSESIDITKYFEVMNSRGKQLEQHQILKSYFLKGLEAEERYKYGVLWDYCSRMDVLFEDFIYEYENKYKSSTKKEYTRTYIREKLEKTFSDTSEDISELIKYEEDEKEDEKQTILELLDSKKNGFEKRREGVKESKSILKFPVFLLQVLNLFKSNEKIQAVESYNDSKLIKTFTKSFNKNISDIEKETKKEFILFLSQMRVLFDYYIFRRDENGKPFLRLLEKNQDKKYERSNQDYFKLMNIQLLFSFTTDYFTQDWIAPTLYFLSKEIRNNGISTHEDNLVEYLIGLDRKIIRARLIGNKLQKIYSKELTNENLDSSLDELPQESLENHVNKGTSVNHYWFYKLDYLLWREKKNDLENLSKHFVKNINLDNYYLKNLSSIEHIFPQTPTEKCKDDKPDNLDMFGNLALISTHMNSKLSNHCFEYKKNLIELQLKNGTVESLKMLWIYSYTQNSVWNDTNMKNHHEEMIQVLLSDINANTKEK